MRRAIVAAAAFLLVTFLPLFPSTATGQPVPPHLSNLEVSVGRAPARDGVKVTAWMDGHQVAQAETRGGSAVITIAGTSSSTGKTISFRIDGFLAAQEDTWEAGGHVDKNFAISPRRSLPPPPHLSNLVVTIDGAPAPDGTEVTAWMDGHQVAQGETRGGFAIITIAGTSSSTGKTISFRIDGIPAAEEDTWEPGGHVDKNFAISPRRSLPPPPHLSNLVVTIDGAPAPDGTEVTAWMDGRQVAQAETRGGSAVITITGTSSTAGKNISFRIDGIPAAEEDTWEPGGHVDQTFAISIKRPSQLPPHLSKLVVAIDHEPAPDGTEVTAWMEGVQVAVTTTRDGVAVIRIPGTAESAGKVIAFRIDRLPAAENDTWEQGGHIDKEFAISAANPGPAPGQPAGSVVTIDDSPARDETLVTALENVVKVEEPTTPDTPATVSIPAPPDPAGETTELKTHGIPSDSEDAVEPIDSAGKEFAIAVKTLQPDETPEPLSNDASPSTTNPSIANPSISKPSVFGPVQRSLYVSTSGIIAFQALEMI